VRGRRRDRVGQCACQASLVRTDCCDAAYCACQIPISEEPPPLERCRRGASISCSPPLRSAAPAQAGAVQGPPAERSEGTLDGLAERAILREQGEQLRRRPPTTAQMF